MAKLTKVAPYILILLVGGVFLSSLWVGYMSDDYDIFASFHQPWSEVFGPFPAGRGTYFRPLPLLTLRLEHTLFGHRHGCIMPSIWRCI